MTHLTDCTVKDEDRSKVQEVANLFWEGRGDEAHEMAKDLGWERLGRGVGRSVYRVSTDDQEGPVESPVHEQPCVVKFAVGKGRYDGQSQNREEIHQFHEFPHELTDPEKGIPAVVPISDYDRGENLWESMPEVEPGGDAGEAEERLAEHGWVCEDLHFDNIGQMHHTSLVLDYGIECSEVDSPEEAAMEIADSLRKNAAQDVEVEQIERGGGAEVTFYPPDWVLNTGRPVIHSTIWVNRRGVRTMDIAFGSYEGDETDYSPPLDTAAENVAEELRDTWLEAEVRPIPEDQERGLSIVFELENHHEPWPPEIAADVYYDLEDIVHRQMPGGEVHELPADEEVIEPEEGMILDHPDFDGLVTIVDVDEKGTIMVEADDGFEYNIQLAEYEDPKRSMVVDDIEGFGKPPAAVDTLQMTISQAVERAVEDEEQRRDIMEEIEKEVDEAVATRPR